MTNSTYKAWLDPSYSSRHDHDDSEQKCWDCGCMFMTSDLVNGKKFWTTDRDWIPLCVPCYEEFERIDAELEREEEKQIDAAIHNDVIKTMRK